MCLSDWVFIGRLILKFTFNLRFGLESLCEAFVQFLFWMSALISIIFFYYVSQVSVDQRMRSWC